MKTCPRCGANLIHGRCYFCERRELERYAAELEKKVKGNKS